MKIFIAGQHGQVSQALQARLASQADLTVIGRAHLDFTDTRALRERVLAERPDVIINAAAYTAVDASEQSPELAFQINEGVPLVFATVATELDIPLVHYSTDYVFDGRKEGLYDETDTSGPLNVYGRSKLAGEEAIRRSHARHLILRTSWVYSWQGTNFLRTMVRLLAERDELNIVDDQRGAPTWTGTIAATTEDLLMHAHERDGWGTYHLTSSSYTSWFGFAQTIAAKLQSEGRLKARLNPIPSSAYPTPAQRPLNSRLSTRKVAESLGRPLPTWETAFEACWQQRPTHG